MRGAHPLRLLLPVLLITIPAVAGVAHLAPALGPHAWRSADFLVSLFVLVLLLVPFSLLSLETVVDRLRRFVDGRPITSLVLAATLICPYALYWSVPGKADLTALCGVVAYVGAVSGAAVLLPRGSRRSLADLGVVLAIWLPVEFRWLDRSFPWPPKGSGRILCGLLALNLLLYLLVVVRRVEGIGYSFALRRGDLPRVLGAFCAFAAAGIPIGFATGFLEVRSGWPGLPDVGEKLVLIFLFTGVPEETLFRGCIQGILERWTARPTVSLLLASVVFGLAHLDNGPVPDWRYAVLAALAGVAYGWVFQKTRRIVAPALTHTLVDATWKLVLSR